MLNELGTLLMRYLAISKAPKGTQAMAFLMLEKEEQQLEMCSFLSENPEATSKEILDTAKQISNKTGC